MEREQIWWRAGGPAGLLAKISRAVGQTARVVCIVTPNPYPKGFIDALKDELRRTLSLNSHHLDFSRDNQRGSLSHLVADRLDVPATEITSIADLVDHPNLADTVAIIDGIDHKELRRWALFLRAVSARSGGPLLGPILIVLLPTGLTKAERKELCATAPVISMTGAISRYDTAAYLSQIGMRADPNLMSRVGLFSMIDVAAWSRDLLDQMLGWKVADQIAPSVPLEKLGGHYSLPYPSFENGLVDLWDDEPAAHAAAAMIHGLSKHVTRRVWAAQTRILMPFTYRILQSFVLRYLDTLQRSVSIDNPYVKKYNDREIRIIDPRRLEFYDVAELTSHVMPDREQNLLKIARWTRHETAHRNVITPARIEELSDHYEANLDILEGDVPGWDWPRCGQELTLTIGPPAAGKSHWAQQQGLPVVSSDEIRKELAGTLEFDADQAIVFREVRDRARKHLAQGESVIINSMNLQPEHPLRQTSVMPRDLDVHYVIIDRPLAEKQRDAGWRAEKGLVEKYHKQFQECVTFALDADHFDKIEVSDLRHLGEASVDA